MSLHQVKYKEFELEYLQIGKVSNNSETEYILAFHGFGRTGSDFNIFSSLLKENQVIYAFNLFQHGNSIFPEDRIPHDALRLSEFKDLMTAILGQLNIQKFGLLGYSLGGKICLMTVQLMAERVNWLFLLAPDGVKTVWTYKFASGTLLGRAIYNWFMENPRLLFKITDLLTSVRIISLKLNRFVHYHMASRERRLLVRDVWSTYRFFNPNIRQIQKKINSHSIQTVLIFGKYDNVIKPWQGKKLNRGLDKPALYLLESGHLLLESKTIDYIRNHDLWPSNSQ